MTKCLTIGNIKLAITDDLIYVAHLIEGEYHEFKTPIDRFDLVYENVVGSFVQYGYIRLESDVYSSTIAIPHKQSFITACKFVNEHTGKKHINNDHDGAPRYPEFKYD